MKTQPVKQDLNTFFAGGTQVTIGQAVEAFLRMEAVKWSDETAIWYRRRLGDMTNSLGAERSLADLMETDVSTWFVEMSERGVRYAGGLSRPEVKGGLSPFTLHGYVRASKRFFRWLYKNGTLAVDLGEALKSPKLPRHYKKGISEANVRAILDAARSNVRDYALITFIESTGVRRGGAESLQLSDLNLDASAPLCYRVTVREKGDKERTVIMSSEACSAVRSWLEERAALGIREGSVFLAQSPGQNWHPIKDVGISEVIDRYKKRLFLTGPCSPHQFRHRWCRRMLENGMPLGQVSLLAGHADVKVTMDFYGGFSIDELQSSYQKFYRKPGE